MSLNHLIEIFDISNFEKIITLQLDKSNKQYSNTHL